MTSVKVKPRMWQQDTLFFASCSYIHIKNIDNKRKSIKSIPSQIRVIILTLILALKLAMKLLTLMFNKRLRSIKFCKG